MGVILELSPPNGLGTMHQRRCLEAWHINAAHAPLNHDDGGRLPNTYYICLLNKLGPNDFFGFKNIRARLRIAFTVYMYPDTQTL